MVRWSEWWATFQPHILRMLVLGRVLRDRLVQPPHLRIEEIEAQRAEVIYLRSTSHFVGRNRAQVFYSIAPRWLLPQGLRKARHQSSAAIARTWLRWLSSSSSYSQRRTQRNQVKGTWGHLGGLNGLSLCKSRLNNPRCKYKTFVIRDYLAALTKMPFQMLSKLHKKFGFNTINKTV